MIGDAVVRSSHTSNSVEFTGAGNLFDKSISSSIDLVVRTHRQSHYDLEIQKRFVAGVI